MDSRVLLVHGDPGILRGLEAGLRSEGFEVQTAQTGVEGLKIFQTTRPSLVMTEVSVGDLDGFSFVTRLRQDPLGKAAAVLLADPGKGPGRRLRAIQAGADSRLTGVDPTRELMTRARLLFGSPKREAAGAAATAPRGFACDLGDLDVLDLVALVQRNGRSGVATVTAPGRVPGSLFFDQGRLIDAQAGHASGMEAFHRLASWTAGALNLEWRNFRRRDVLARTPGELITSGLAHLEEWTQLLARLAPPNTVFRVDLDALIDRLSSSGGQLTEVLNACDGVRSVVQIVDECSIGALDVVRSLLQLRDDGLISDPGRPARIERPKPDSLESTLMGGGAGTHHLPVSPPAPAASPPAPRHDSPAMGARLTVPMGHAGLPVSVPEKKKLPAVTMQFPSGLPMPGRQAPVEAPGMPPALPPPPAATPPPATQPAPQANAPEAPSPVEAESPSARVTMARSLPSRVSRARPGMAGAPTISLPRAPQIDAGASVVSKTIVPSAPPQAVPQPSVALVRPEPQTAAPPILTITRQPPVDRGAPEDAPEAPVVSPHVVGMDNEQRRPWWERRNERRPARPVGDVSSDAKWDPVWPPAALEAPPPDASDAHARPAREPAKAAPDSPTVYLPASPSSPEGARGQRRPPYAEGIRRKPPARNKRGGKKARKGQPHLALLVGGAIVLLVALTAIGVALVRSIGR